MPGSAHARAGRPRRPSSPRRASTQARKLRALGLVGRFALSYAAIGALLYAVHPVLFPLLARTARNLLAASSSVPPIADVFWAGGFVFRVRSPLLGITPGGSSSWIAFTLVFPLAFALALPGITRGTRSLRCATIAMSGLALWVLLLAVNCADALGSALESQGLAVYPAWRLYAQRELAFWTWSLAAILFPCSASLYALAPLIPALQLPTPIAASRRRGAAIALLLSLALALAALDGFASRRLERLELGELLGALEPFNPDLGGYLVRVGEAELAAGRRAAALELFRAALDFPGQREHARDGLERASVSDEAPPDP